jgi:outer membrane receptor protein involved in Fe transport
MTRSRKRKLARARARSQLPIKRACWVSIPLASAVLTGNAFAAADAAPADAGEGLAEVVVTAEKHSEDLQKVPISLTVLSAETLEQHQVASFDDYAKFLPSVSYQSLGPGQAQLYFRGIASGNDGLHAGSLPATGVYLDETPVTTIGNSLDVHAYDISRVEALAGPQGTLYGASSLSGTLRIITNKPDPTKFEAGYDVEGNTFGRGDAGGQFEGFVNIPVTDSVAVRLVGFYERQGGYINNVQRSDTIQYGFPANPDSYYGINPEGLYGLTGPLANYLPTTYTNASAVKRHANDVSTYGGRAALRVNLTENWTITPMVVAQSQKSDGNFTFDPNLGDLNVGDYRLGFNKDRWYQSALTVEGKVADFDLVYSGGWFERKVDNLVDYSGYTIGYDQAAQSPDASYNANYVFIDPATGKPLYPMQYNLNHDKYTKMSHELRVSSPANYPLRATAGLFYQRQTDAIRAEFNGDTLPDIWAVDGSPRVYYLSQQTRTDRDYALFMETTYDLTSQLKVTGGIRKFWVNNTLFGFFGFNPHYGTGERLCEPPVGPDTIIPGYWPCINTRKKVVEDGETHKLNLTYQIDPTHMVYFTYSTGFRPGGNNRRPEVAAYAADTLINLEFGWKTSWLDNRVRYNGAIFRERWKGVQYSITGANGITSIVNAGDAVVRGIENDLQWLATDHLELSASATYVNAHITQNFCNADPVTEQISHTCDDPKASAGTPLPVTPRFKANGTARYKFNVGSLESYFQSAIVHQSASRSDLRAVENSEFGSLDPFMTVDLAMGTGKDNWHVEAFITNAFDRRGIIGRTAASAADYSFINHHDFPIKPRLFGIKFGQKF